MRRLSRLALLAPLLLFASCQRESRASREEVATVDLPSQSEPAAAPNAAAPGQDALSRSSADGAASGGANPAAPRQPPSNAAAVDSAPPRMIIRTGTATLRVDKLEPAIARVQRIAEQMGGYVASTSVQSGRDEAREATLELKLPAGRWDQALAGLRPLGDVEALTTATEDVGEEFVDVTARMENARRLEQRLVELLANRTGRLEDVLAVERELARVREEIERYEGRLRFLRSRVSLSTLTVKLHEPVPVIGGRPGGNPIVDAFRTAWDNFVGFLAAFIASLGWMIPLGVIVAALVWSYRKLMRARRPAAPGSGPGLGMHRGGPVPGAGPPPAHAPDDGSWAPADSDRA